MYHSNCGPLYLYFSLIEKMRLLEPEPVPEPPGATIFCPEPEPEPEPEPQKVKWLHTPGRNGAGN